MLTTVTPGAQELSIASSAASPPNEAPYPTLVGTATIGTPVSPPTTDGSAPSMPATTTRQSAASSRSRTAEQPVQPGHADVLDQVDRRRRAPATVSAASAATGASRGAGRDDGHRAARLRQRAQRHRPGDRVDVGLGQRRRHLGERLLGEPGGEHRALGVPLVEGAQDRDDLAGRLAGAVHHLGVAGPPRAVDVDAREPQIVRSSSSVRGSFSSTPKQASRACTQRGCWLVVVTTGSTHYAQGTPSYVELTTPDQQAAKEFYGPLFGWEFEDVDHGRGRACYVAVSVAGRLGRRDRPGRCRSWRATRRSGASTWPSTTSTRPPPRSVPAGGKVEAGPFDVMELGRMASIQDPTGVRVNLWQAGQSIGSVRVNEPGCPIWHELLSPDLPAATSSTATCSASSGRRCRWRPATTTPA